MSNYLAIAHVTAALQQRLAHAVSNVMPGTAVTTLPPDRLIDAQNLPGINLFFFQATPNAALRNADQPTRDAQGTLQRPTQSALDLHYLLTFLGKGELYEPERLLALATIAFDARSVLLPQMLEAVAGSAPGELLQGSDLPAQAEIVRLTHTPPSMEDLHRFWTLFNATPYRLSTVYRASVVLLEGPEVPRRVRLVRRVDIPVSPSLDAPPGPQQDQLGGIGVSLKEFVLGQHAAPED